MADEKSGGVAPDAAARDLFGNTIEPIRDRRGRPSFKKDKENQQFVMVRVAEGWTHKAIAANMGIDEKTLRKHFSRELTDGGVHIRGMLLDVLVHKAREGHTPSVRLLLERLDGAGPLAPRNHPRADDDDDPKAPALGKKEQRVQDAQAVPDDYGDIYARLEGRRQH